MIFFDLFHSILKAFRFILKKPVVWIAEKVSSAPDKEAVMKALTELYQESEKLKSRKLKRLNLKALNGRIIIFSDQHRGIRNGSDDFAICEKCYLINWK